MEKVMKCGYCHEREAEAWINGKRCCIYCFTKEKNKLKGKVEKFPTWLKQIKR